MTYRPPGKRAVTPQGRGRFPDFDVLDQTRFWDEITAGAVLARLAPPNDLGFFTVGERAVADPLLDLLLGQDSEPRIPILGLIDTRLAIGETDGWHYDELPEDGQAWRDTLAGLDAEAHTAHGVGFAELPAERQSELVQAVQDAAGDRRRWRDWPAQHVWSLWTRYACTAFYSHPWAWNEIGFPGPAYPRGYANIGIDARDRWEVADRGPADGERSAAPRSRRRRS